MHACMHVFLCNTRVYRFFLVYNHIFGLLSYFCFVYHIFLILIIISTLACIYILNIKYFRIHSIENFLISFAFMYDRIYKQTPRGRTCQPLLASWSARRNLPHPLCMCIFYFSFFFDTCNYTCSHMHTHTPTCTLTRSCAPIRARASDTLKYH